MNISLNRHLSRRTFLRGVGITLAPDPLTPRHRPTPDPFPARRGQKQIPCSQIPRRKDSQPGMVPESLM